MQRVNVFKVPKTTAYSLLYCREVDRWSEEWRHECEARSMAKLGATRRRLRYARILKRRDPKAAYRIKFDTMVLRLMKQLYHMTLPQVEAARHWLEGTHGSAVVEVAIDRLRHYWAYKENRHRP